MHWLDDRNRDAMMSAICHSGMTYKLERVVGELGICF